MLVISEGQKGLNNSQNTKFSQLSSPLVLLKACKAMLNELWLTLRPRRVLSSCSGEDTCFRAGLFALIGFRKGEPDWIRLKACHAVFEI